jgi:hypothetical protein
MKISERVEFLYSQTPAYLSVKWRHIAILVYKHVDHHL